MINHRHGETRTPHGMFWSDRSFQLFMLVFSQTVQN